MKVVAVVGASKDSTRYSFMAIKLLQELGHTAIPIHPSEKEILGLEVVQSLKELAGKEIDTITIYVNPSISGALIESILSVHPKRVIFNPGAENVELLKELTKNGIECENACTLVLLRTGTF